MKSPHMNWLCLVSGGKKGVGVWQIGGVDVSHIPASITSTRVNSPPRDINNKFYFLGQVHVHTLDTSVISVLQLGR